MLSQTESVGTLKAGQCLYAGVCVASTVMLSLTESVGTLKEEEEEEYLCLFVCVCDKTTWSVCVNLRGVVAMVKYHQ